MPLVFKPLGDSAIRMGVADEPAPHVQQILRGWSHCLEESPIAGVVEWVPSYVALTVFYRPQVIRYAELCRRLKRLSVQAAEVRLPPARVISLPVCYGGEFGPDLEFVAQHHGLTPQQVIEQHTAPQYLVYMMGFVPGFAYLAGLPEALATPRLPNPRLAAPAGSVGIGGSQTGVYPLKTPGGWRLIGHTPVRLFDPTEASPFLLAHGDYVRFQPVTLREHDDIQHGIERGSYVVPSQTREEPDERPLAH